MMYASINGTKVLAVYVEPKQNTIPVAMPENWRNHHISYEGGVIVLGEEIDNTPQPLE